MMKHKNLLHLQLVSMRERERAKLSVLIFFFFPLFNGDGRRITSSMAATLHHILLLDFVTVTL